MAGHRHRAVRQHCVVERAQRRALVLRAPVVAQDLHEPDEALACRDAETEGARPGKNERDLVADVPPASLEVEHHDMFRRRARIPEHGNRVLRVVYNERTVPWRIVTAFFDRNAGRHL